jgi:RHS repeat-associated protein
VRDAQGNVMSVYEHKVDNTAQTLTYTQQEKHIYGSSRVGMDVAEKDMITPTITEQSFYRESGKKQYELSNHLGNVLTVITDKKQAVESTTTTGTVDYFVVEILSASDYSPFGVLLKNRNFTGEKYRYGFNGQEKDDEIKGSGNSYSYEYRFHDPRLGRFLSIDPLAAKYAYNSPYAFCENRVIDGIELEGLEYVNATAPVTKDVQNEDGSTTTTQSTFGAEFGDLYEMVQIDGVDYYNVGRDFYQDDAGYVHLQNQDGAYNLLSEFPAASEVWDRPVDPKYMSAFVPYDGSLPQCFDYACASAGKLGNPTGPGYWLWSIQMSNPESTKGLPITSEGQQKGSYFINKALEKNTTVVVGLYYCAGDGGGNPDGTTDHFVYVGGSGWDTQNSRPYIIVVENAYIHGQVYNMYWDGNTFVHPNGTTKVTQVFMTPTLMKPSNQQTNGDRKVFNVPPKR